ncbi:Heme transporter BhuA [Oligella sp. MSHR50489EDL]|uniref:TonB-dependent receptor domain-containing protein n=1 Tax=Oligella sp. MSHR50489EDL TaxID=3139409 RepID=UPI003D8141D6
MKLKLKNSSSLVLAAFGALSGSIAVAQDQSVVDLGTIVVNSQGTKVISNLITQDELNESTETDLRGLLAKEASIDFGGGNGTSSFLTLRGMGQNSVDVKIDNAYSDSQILYHQARFIVDPSLLKSISVQKGAGSASAGIGATNGAVVATTVDALDLLKRTGKNFGFRLNSGYASDLGHSYGATVYGQAGNFDALVSYQRIDEQNFKPGKGYKNFEGGKTYLYSALDKRNFLAKLGATFGNHRIVLSHMQNQHRGERLVREEFGIGGPRLTPERQSPSYRETTLSNTNLEYTAQNLGFISQLNANAYIMRNKRYSSDDSGCGYCGNIAGPTTTNIITKGLNINFDSTIGQSILLKYGINERHQQIKPHQFFLPGLVEPTKHDTGAYAEAISSVGDFTITAGLRYDYFKMRAMDSKKASGSKVNPSFGVIWQATDNLSFNVSHNYASRSPRLYDALLTHGKRGIVSVADGIKAERARNTEIGLNYENGPFYVSAGYFWQKINNAIANPQDRHGFKGVREAVNAGIIKNRGYEINAAYRGEALNASIGVSKSNPRIYDTHPGNLLSANPEFAVPVGRTWVAGLSYRFKEPNLELGWRGRFVEKAEGSVLVRNNDNPAHEERRNAFNLHDIYLNWKPLDNDSLNINVAVNNVFNKFYYPHSQRSMETTPPGVGRTFRVGVNYQY